MAQFHLHLLASLLLLQLFLLQPFWKLPLLSGLAEGQAVRVATNLLLPFELGNLVLNYGAAGRSRANPTGAEPTSAPGPTLAPKVVGLMRLRRRGKAASGSRIVSRRLGARGREGKGKINK